MLHSPASPRMTSFIEFYPSEEKLKFFPVWNVEDRLFMMYSVADCKRSRISRERQKSRVYLSVKI